MKKKTTEQFIYEANIKHDNYYLYDKTIYTGNKNKVIIICPIHGEFMQPASSHLLGHKCERCSYEIRAKNKTNKTYYRKWFLNEHYFKTIDTYNKAYFLGLIYADGCIYDKDKLVEIGLNIKDIDILIKYKNELDYKKPFKYNKDNSVYVSICSHKMYNDLVNLGCTSNKSLTIEFPSNNVLINNNYINHFIRGYFDGDGCLSISKNKQACLSILGSNNFLITLKNYLKSNYNIKCSIYKYDTSKIYKLCISNKEDIIKFSNLIYSDCNDIFLIRKKNKFIEYEQNCNNRKNRKNNSII